MYLAPSLGRIPLSHTTLRNANFFIYRHLYFFCRAKQHVPLTEYVTNMKTIVSHFRSRAVPAIILITPPPVHEPSRLKHALVTYNITLKASERTNEVAGQYADAVIALGNELSLPVVNLWREFQEIDDWGTTLLNDGLHLTPEGNQFVGKLVLKTITENFKQLQPEKMKWDVPEWSAMADAENAEEVVATYRANNNAILT